MIRSAISRSQIRLRSTSPISIAPTTIICKSPTTLCAAASALGTTTGLPSAPVQFAEPVERIISTTSDELTALYTRGLFAVGEATPPEEMALQIEKQNLMARINLPMGRVEIRTDEGGHSLDLDIANLTLKHLLLLRIYSDPRFARSFRYDREDISRARANENLAAKHGLRAEIENPLTGKPISIRAFLKWTLNEVKPLAEALNLWNDLTPLVEMAEGGRNTSEKLRARLQMELGENDEVPLSVLKELFYEREAQVKADVERIASEYGSLGEEASKIGEFLQRGRDAARQTPQMPDPVPPAHTGRGSKFPIPTKPAEILDLAQQLIRIPSVTACPNERLDEVHRAGSLIDDYLEECRLGCPVTLTASTLQCMQPSLNHPINDRSASIDQFSSPVTSTSSNLNPTTRNSSRASKAIISGVAAQRI